MSHVVEVSTSVRRLVFEIGGEEYAAVSYGQPWNGFVTPVVTRATAATMALNLADPDYYRWTWDGDVLVIHSVEYGTDERITPDADGNYDFGMIGFVFSDETEHEDGDGVEYVVTRVWGRMPADSTYPGLRRMGRDEAVANARRGDGTAVPVRA